MTLLRYSLAATLLLSNIVNAQLRLPNPAWLPPSPESGAQPSSSTARPNQHWSTLLGNLLYFYDAQRSGKLTSNRVLWRNDSAVNDGADDGLDLSGGFYDAGNYLKMTYPLSWVLTSLCWGAMDFGSGYNDAGQTPYLDHTLRVGLDWLIKAHPEERVLYVQVGDVDANNDYWGGDQDIPQPRPAYKIDDSHPGTDAAAAASAAFASCSLLYSNTSIPLFTPPSVPAALTNKTYAQTLLTHSKQLLSFAANSTAEKQVYQNAVPDAGKAYGSHGYGDDLALAAAFLAFAENSTDYYNLAKQWWDEYELEWGAQNLDWDSKSSAVPVLLSQILSIRPEIGAEGDLDKWKKEAEKRLDSIAAADGPGYLTPGGLLWYDGVSDLTSLSPALNAAMLLLRYAQIASTRAQTNAYLSFAKLQLDYVLGNNPMQVPYVVGLNPNSPKNPHSAPASGGNDIGRVDDVPATMAHVLYGAVVGGPDRNDQYWDIRSDWVQTEVALDYNAPLLTLAAWKVYTDGNDPFYVRLQAGAYDSRKPQGSRPCRDPWTACDADPIYKFDRGEQIATGVIMGLGGALVLSFSLWYAYNWWVINKKPV